MQVRTPNTFHQRLILWLFANASHSHVNVQANVGCEINRETITRQTGVLALEEGIQAKT